MGVEETKKSVVKHARKQHCCHTHTHLHTVLNIQVVQLWPCLDVVRCRCSKSWLPFIIVGCLFLLFSTCIVLAPSVSIQPINNRPITVLAESLVQLFVYVLTVNKISTFLAQRPPADSVSEVNLGKTFSRQDLNVGEFPHASFLTWCVA